MKFWPSALVFGVCVWFLAGCSGGGGGKGPATAKVGGTVNLDGKPMAGGEVRFNVAGQPVKSLEVKDGTFAGEVFTGKNRVDVVWDKDGPPNPMNPSERIKVNAVSDQYSGPNSPFNVEIGAGGDTSLKFDVKSARK